MMISKVQKIRNALGNSTNWALTGSSALWYHAMINGGVRPRVPEDIDIAASPSFFKEAVARLASMNGWKIDIMESRATHVVLKKGDRTIDVFVAGGDLAPSMRHRVKYPGLPALMSLNSLYKRKTGMNLPRTKNLNNINVLRRLGAKTPAKSPRVRRSPSISPVRRRISPMGSPVRKFSFGN
jgi:hypothetical protein